MTPLRKAGRGAMSGNLRRSDIIRLALLWWAGVNLRITLLAVPPAIPLIHEDLALDPVLVGALNALPILLFAALAVGGSRLIARIGARRALVVGLLTVRSEAHTSELQSLMRISYAVFCLKKKTIEKAKTIRNMST